MQPISIQDRQRQYRVTGLVLFIIAAGSILCRMLVYGLSYAVPQTDGGDYILTAIFTVLTQLGLFLIMPFLVYKLMLKKNVRETLRFQNYRNPDWWLLPIGLALGVLAQFISMGLGLFWDMLLYNLTGYYSPSDPMPETFNALFMVLDFLLIGIFAGVCEENAHRGGLLTTMRGSFSDRKTVLLMGLIFALFHQSADQFLYTFAIGAALTYLVIKGKSIYPAMLMHFASNAFGVFLGYSYTYDFFGKEIFGFINEKLQSGVASDLAALFGLFVLVLVLFAGLLVLFRYLCKRNRRKQIDKTVRAVESGEIADAVPDTGVVGVPLSDTVLYRPTPRDNMFHYGALVLAVLTTVFSIIRGIM